MNGSQLKKAAKDGRKLQKKIPPKNAAWDGTVDMADISSYYINTMEADIESFKKLLPNVKIYGEINYVTRQVKSSSGMQARRFTNVETYRGTAFNYLSRGADGICLFNFDYIVDPNGWEDTVDKSSPSYVPLERRGSLAKEIKGISDVEFLKRASKNYVINNRFDCLKKSDDEHVRIIIPDDTSRFKFSKAVLRVETDKPCADLDISASLNGTKLEMFEPSDTELFKPISVNEASAARDCLKFYKVPLGKIICGENTIDIKNLSAAKASRKYVSIELGVYE